jgi:hypothetical protein
LNQCASRVPVCPADVWSERGSPHIALAIAGIHGGTKAREINVEELRVLGMVYPMGNPEFNEKPP